MKWIRLSVYPLVALQLTVAAAMIVTAVVADQWWVRLVDILVACVNVAMTSWFLGRKQMADQLEKGIGWMPKSVHVNETDEKKTAIVETNGGELITIDLPEEIDNAQDAMRFILSQLAPE